MIPRGWAWQNLATAADLYTNVIDGMDPAGQLVFPDKMAAYSKQLNMVLSHWSPYTFMVLQVTPNWTRAFSTTTANQTMVNQARIACALERYRLAHGEYPESLDALVPQFIDVIPHDVIGGQPPHYRRNADGTFLLYSIGWSQKDHGGHHDSNTYYNAQGLRFGLAAQNVIIVPPGLFWLRWGHESNCPYLSRSLCLWPGDSVRAVVGVASRAYSALAGRRARRIGQGAERHSHAHPFSFRMPDKATGAAMVVCPGGGYGGLASYEGDDYARWLNDQGIAGFVLKYRLGSAGYRHPRMLEDAARALRLVRFRAADWKLDPKRIGIIGSSAGGHLASTLLTHFDAGRRQCAGPHRPRSAAGRTSGCSVIR